MLKDYKGENVVVGDLVMEDRGVVYRVVDEAGLGAEGCAKGEIVAGRPNYPKGLVETIRVHMMFLMGSDMLDFSEGERTTWWLDLYTEHVAPNVSAVVKGRQHMINEDAKEKGWRGGTA